MGELEQREQAGCDGEECDDPTPALFSRRRLLGTTIAGATASVLAGSGPELAVPSPARAQSVKSPAEALQALMDDGSRRVRGMVIGL